MDSSPRPWACARVLDADNNPLYEITVAGDGVVAYVEAHDDTDRDNATLIRLAPDMAAMLRALEWNHDFSCPICGASEMSWPKEAGLDRHNIGCRLAALLKACAG